MPSRASSARSCSSPDCFLIGVFGFSLLLIVRLAPDAVPQLPRAPSYTDLNLWIFGVLSLAAVVTGGTGLILRLVSISASSEMRSAMASRAGSIEIAPQPDELGKLPSVPRGATLTDSPGERLTYRLAAAAPEGGITGPATLAILWNSVWFILLAVVVSGFWYGRARWILTLLLIPFGTIGAWSFQFLLAQLRKHAGVGPTIVEISSHPLYPGSRYDLFICQRGRLKLKRLTVQLTCEEETFYRQGTDVRVDRCEAFTEVLLKQRDVLVDPKAPWEQQLRLDLPLNVMHSFVGSHNAIRWKVVVRGESTPWPSFCRSFPVIVHPPGPPPNRSPR